MGESTGFGRTWSGKLTLLRGLWRHPRRAALPVPAAGDEARIAERERIEADRLTEALGEAAAYRSSAQYRDLLRFVARMRRFSPFNAALLHRQKPGLKFAATARDWRARWKRAVKRDARPLVVLVSFGPVGFVYDVVDTLPLPGAPPLPRDAFAFPTVGAVGTAKLAAVMAAVEAEGIQIVEVDSGDRHAGRITRRFLRAGDALLTLRVNRNHPPATRFATIAHELAHLYLGHLDADAKRRIPNRRHVAGRMREIEAESVAWLVASRHGVELRTDAYLSGFIEAGEPIGRTLDVDRVMRAAGAVERVMGLDGGRGRKAPRE